MWIDIKAYSCFSYALYSLAYILSLIFSCLIFWVGGSTALLHETETGEQCCVSRVNAWGPAGKAQHSIALLFSTKSRKKCQGDWQEYLCSQQCPQHTSCCAWLGHAITSMSNSIVCHKSWRRGEISSSESMGNKAIISLEVLKVSRERQSVWFYSIWSLKDAYPGGFYYQIYLHVSNFSWALLKTKI